VALLGQDNGLMTQPDPFLREGFGQSLKFFEAVMALDKHRSSSWCDSDAQSILPNRHNPWNRSARIFRTWYNFGRMFRLPWVGSAMIDQQRGVLRRSIWSEVERTIEERIDRYLSVNHQWLIGNHHFAHASHECLLLYRDGYFTSCIMVAQAVSDGILEFIRDRDSVQQAEEESKQALAKRMQPFRRRASV
jgi:hypothetical protein